jgi:hyperosmotically inducible protein
MRKMLFVSAICAMCAVCVSCSCDSNKNNNQTSDCPADVSQADWKITAAVKKKLMADSTLSSSARMISVTTNNGVVTLTGTVTCKDESRKVVSIVESVDGVKGVDNQLTMSQ